MHFVVLWLHLFHQEPTSAGPSFMRKTCIIDFCFSKNMEYTFVSTHMLYLYFFQMYLDSVALVKNKQ